MRNSVSAFGFRTVSQAVAAVLLAGMSAACSNSTRLSEPFFTGSTANQRDIIGDGSADPSTAQPMPPVASDAVTRADLPPPPAATYVASASAPAYDADGQSVYGWTAVGGQVVTIKPGESLDNLAVKYGVPAEQILAANQMTSPAQVRPGRIVVIPVRARMPADRTNQSQVAVFAPTAAPAVTPPAQTIATDASTYVVQSGDTLFSVARRSGMKPTEIAAMNGISTDTQLQIGQTLRLKAGAGTAVAANAPPKALGAPPKMLGTLTVASNAPGAAPVAAPTKMITLAPPAQTAETGQLVLNAPKAPAMPTIPVNRATDTTATNASATAIDNATDAASSDGKSFRWPVRGRIISGFGTKPNGEKNDGINLAVPEGTSVKAVETGTVIYAGNELEGYGNLVLIRHADGWVSAYAHNKDILVKRGDTVRRGQTVAHAGMTGSVASPQVHFELRKGAKPVNPLDYLAGA